MKKSIRAQQPISAYSSGADISAQMTGRNGSELALDVQSVTKQYHTKLGTVEALSEVSFSVAKQTFVSLLGPSGCGKTTLLNILGGLDIPSSGQVFLHDRTISSQSRGRDIGFVFQNPNLFPWRSVFRNVTMPLEILGINSAENLEKARQLLRTVGLAGFEDAHPENLSGGMKQRVAVSRALVYDPSVLLMDEPFAALDAITREEMAAWLLRLWNEEKKTVVFVTHNIQEAVFLSDRILVMSPRPGRIVADVEVDLARPRDIRKAYESSEFNQLIAELYSLLLHTTQSQSTE